MIILKIDIVGSVASGKTTLSRKISKEFNIPHYEKDNVVWKRTPSGDVKRTPQERDAYFNDIISKKEWVVEGSPRQSLKESYDCYDYIIVLNEYTLTRLIRVFKRWINQRRGKEKYNSKPTLKFLWQNITGQLHFQPNLRFLLYPLDYIIMEKTKNGGLLFNYNYNSANRM